MNIEEASLYLKHTSKDDFNLEEHQKVNRYEAIQVVLEEIERLNNIINELENFLNENWNKPMAEIYVSDVVKKIVELKEENDNTGS